MAKYIRRTSEYVVLDPEGDSLVTIAANWTLDPGYALAIANYNGMDPGQADPSYSLPAGESVAVPLNWIKPAIAGAIANAPAGALVVDIPGAGGVASGVPDWVLWGVVGVVAAAVLLA